MNKIRVAIAGVGNAASAFYQSILFYSNQGSRGDPDNFQQAIGPYKIQDVEIVAAFDIGQPKVGKRLSDAIFEKPNVLPKMVEVMTDSGPIVRKGPVLDGIGDSVDEILKESTAPEESVNEVLQQADAEILVALLPTGAHKATERYAEEALQAEVGFINCTPTKIASTREWGQKFKRASLPLVGDDLQSMLGGTRIHKGILELLNAYGAKIEATYQLDVSGGLEGLNTLEVGRRLAKRAVKSEAIRQAVPYLPVDKVASGTTDYMDFLENRRVGFFWIEGAYFMDAPFQLDISYKSLDGPNAAAMLVDIVRATRIAMDRVIDGPLVSVSAHGFKCPPLFTNEYNARVWFSEFLEGKRNA
ncbi:MAG: inositol-3-phosphate synthase [Candidatus Heimdallarchaeota archaeon]